jgi:hypothetical protein
MRTWRAESVLDLYNIVLGMVLSESPVPGSRKPNGGGRAAPEQRYHHGAVGCCEVALVNWEEWDGETGSQLQRSWARRLVASPRNDAFYFNEVLIELN